MNNSKIVVGMSGGVDSSTAAILLKEKKYNVIGATIITHGEKVVADAAREICEKIGIEHHVIDLSVDFKSRVIDCFSKSYIRGETPNPCVECNFYIKFGKFREIARELGAEYIATGHFVKKIFNEELGRWLLYKGADPKKDQSYMLYKLNQIQLAHSVFPLGEYSKTEVREIARNNNLLDVSQKAESQEICFIPDNDYCSFISSKVKNVNETGNFIDCDGNIIGKHKGIINYTIGQRKGLGTTFGKPMFVVAIDPQKNEVILGENKDVFTNELWATDLNWIAFDKLIKPRKAMVKIRYQALPVPAVIREEEKGIFKVIFESPQRAVTPGQSVVFYEDSLVLGGGKIISDVRGIRKDLLNI
ncbi:MAG: tRNA 2-thiouridine(34) synthase MnmA [Eubacteriales bacterium]